MTDSPDPYITNALHQLFSGQEIPENVLQVVNSTLENISRTMLGKNPTLPLEPPDLVSEAWIRFLQYHPTTIASRAHFYSMAARCMRQILMREIRNRQREKHGGRSPIITFTSFEDLRAFDFSIINSAFEALEQSSSRQSFVAECRVFAGLSHEEIANFLGVSVPTVQLDWGLAKAYLRVHVKRSAGPL